jgi:hypothetical protein
MITSDQLMSSFQKSKFAKLKGEFLQFEGIEDMDAFNPALIQENGKTYLAARVEHRESDWNNLATYHPQIMFFEKAGEVWKKIPSAAPVFDFAEDPFCTWINDGKSKKLLFGYVRYNRNLNNRHINTRFFLADSLFSLKEDSCILEVEDMRDIRVLQLPFDELLICGRPIIDGNKRISLKIVKSINEVTNQSIQNAQLLETNIGNSLNIGTNQILLLRRGVIGTLGHVTHEDQNGEYVYNAAVWRIDINKRSMSTPTIIATRKNFPTGQAKNMRLEYVVFPGGLEELSDGKMRLYTGINDVNCGQIDIPNPFE